MNTIPYEMKVLIADTVNMLIARANESDISHWVAVNNNRISVGTDCAPSNVVWIHVSAGSSNIDRWRCTICMDIIEKMTTATNDVSLTATEIDLIVQRNKIGAIKEYRSRTGMGLRDSKDAIDQYCLANNIL